MPADTFFLGENAQSFKTAPKFDVFDMVVLNIDEKTYISSPYVTVNPEKWTGTTGEIEFSYDPTSGTWLLNGSENTEEVLESVYGITTHFATNTPQPKAGDVITVRRFVDNTDPENPTVELSVEITRSGQKMEANCPLVKPSERQSVADDLLRSICSYQYQPFQASGAEVNPLMELGDGITAHGIYSGMFEQTLNFESMMTSEIGAPWAEETESEYNYETARERKFSRKFAEISAEFEITASNISAKVSRTGTGTGFGWSLIESAFKVFVTGHENNPEFMVDANGLSVAGNATFTGEVRATSGYIGDANNGFQITAKAIYNGVVANSGQDIAFSTLDDANSSRGIYLGTDGIYAGGGKFKVTPAGAVTASDLLLNGGEIRLGGTAANPTFHVNSNGEVTASSLTVLGGDIRIGGDYSNPNFHVTSQGYLYAKSGTFEGTVSAGNIQYGGDHGTFSGAGLTDGSLSYGSGGAFATGWYSGAFNGNEFAAFTSQSGSRSADQFRSTVITCRNIAAQFGVTAPRESNSSNGGYFHGRYHMVWSSIGALLSGASLNKKTATREFMLADGTTEQLTVLLGTTSVTETTFNYPVVYESSV